MNFIKKVIKLIFISLVLGIVWQCQDNEFSKFSIENAKEKDNTTALPQYSPELIKPRKE